MAEWSEAELRATVRVYLAMLAAEQAGQAYSTAKIRQRLREGALTRRSEPNVEYRMRNIAAVLASHGRPTIKGYLPAANVGGNKARLLWRLVQAEAGFDNAGPPIIYFIIGWMKRYAGVSDADETKGSDGYLQEHGHGAGPSTLRRPLRDEYAAIVRPARGPAPNSALAARRAARARLTACWSSGSPGTRRVAGNWWWVGTGTRPYTEWSEGSISRSTASGSAAQPRRQATTRRSCLAATDIPGPEQPDQPWRRLCA